MSWTRLKEFAFVREDETWKFVRSLWNDGTRVFYHQECYKAYTLPSALKRICKLKRLPPDQFSMSVASAGGENGRSVSREVCSLPIPPSAEPRRSKRFSLATIKELSVICQQSQKSHKSDRCRKELLVKRTQENPHTLPRAARLRQDKRILVHLKATEGMLLPTILFTIGLVACCRMNRSMKIMHIENSLVLCRN